MVLRARHKREVKMKRRSENVENNSSCPLCGTRLRCGWADSSVFAVNILPRHNKEILYIVVQYFFVGQLTTSSLTVSLSLTASIRGTAVGNLRIFIFIHI